MKNVKEYNFFLNEGKKEKEELSNALDEVATNYWKKRGAKFGKIQTINDFNINFDSGDYASIPARFENDTKFKTLEAKIEVGGFNGRQIVCALWIVPFKKDGKEGQPIRLSWGYAS